MNLFVYKIYPTQEPLILSGFYPRRPTFNGDFELSPEISTVYTHIPPYLHRIRKYTSNISPNAHVIVQYIQLHAVQCIEYQALKTRNVCVWFF